MKTLSYNDDLYTDVMENMTDYFQIGETVCGAQDPAVIDVTDSLADKHPELVGFTVVRVKETYVNPWRSDTVLEFSTTAITPEEYSRYEELAE